MADIQIRAFSIFVEGTKMGSAYDGTLHWAGGDEPNFGDNGGIVVYSDGVQQTTLDFTAFEPVTGLDFDLEQAMLTKTNVNVSLGLINGRIYQMRGRILEVSHKSEVKSGRLDGSFKIGGSAPVLAPG
jgi:hypothetical protein